jgi:hypothetical protein
MLISVYYPVDHFYGWFEDGHFRTSIVHDMFEYLIMHQRFIKERLFFDRFLVHLLRFIHCIVVILLICSFTDTSPVCPKQ